MKLLLLALATIAPFAIAQPAAPEKGWLDMCEKDPASLVCSVEMFKDLKAAQVYRSDIYRHGRREHWSSQLERYLRRNVVAGDCEDFAITAIELALIHDMATPANTRLIICRAPGQKVKHAIADINGHWFDYLYPDITNKDSNQCKPIKHLDLASMEWVKS